MGVLPPALLPLLDPDRLPHLRDLVTAGEPPGPEQVERWSAPPRRRFHNWYGPTEATVVVVETELTGRWDRPVPIGRPLGDNRIHILDEDMQPCPPGAVGELHIGGPQVARGYLGRPALTAQRFVPDPFGPPGSRLYRTGDLAREGPDGVIDYVGRRDRQVKIQGQRVEIGEVEATVRGHPRVQHAVVDVVGELVAYVTPLTAPDLGDLRPYCAERLPAYMLPTRVVRLDALPLNAAGKVDLAALREPEPAAAPSGRRVADIWGRILEVASPAPDDGFIASGGHSLRAMRLVSALREELGAEIPVEEVLGATLGDLTKRVGAAAAADHEAVPTGAAPALSPAQHRMWFVERLAPGTTAHNIAIAERLRGPLDVAALQAALTAVVARHDVLRWRLVARSGVPEVVVAPPAEVPLPIDEVDDLSDLLEREARAPFDLAAGPLLRARLVRLGPDEHVLLLTIHHLVFDGWSQDVLYQDLAEAYGSGPLEPLAVGFADHVAWLREKTARDGARHLAWWTDHLAGVPTVLDLPRDTPRPPVQTFAGESRDVESGAELAGRVEALAERVGTTPSAVLLAAFGLLLRRLTGQTDLVVGTPFADRRHRAFEPVVGLCLQILPLRLTTSDDGGFAEHVRRAQHEVLQAIEHCDAPLDRVVEALDVPRDLSRSPLTQVLFNMYNFAEPRLHLPGCTAEPLPAGLPGSLFDLTLYVSPGRDGFAFRAVYNPDLYSAERIDALLAAYVVLLDSLVTQPDSSVREATLRPPQDGSDPLLDWDGPGVVERFVAAAQRSPDKVAVTGPSGSLTYRALNDLRLRATKAVLDAGVEPGQAVAVLATRCVTLPAQLLGVLGAGARWAILDPAHPPAVLTRQIAAVDARALPSVADAPADTPPPPLEERGYLAFTSGTTGEPKVVVAPERALAHFLDVYARAFDLGADDRFALLSGLAHDPALRDMFTPLVVGGTLCVPEQEWLRDPGRLGAWLVDERISVVHLTPQLARLLYQSLGDGSLPALRLILLGGDQAVGEDAAGLRRVAPGARVVVAYGTTETPQVHAWYEVGADDGTLPVGRGVDGSQLIVLDESGSPAGVGELGEVVVRSRFLADGYLDPVLTADRFGDDRYRTGDLGRYRPDGTVVLAGRRDDQVKVRGFRVELGEIEAALLGHPGVRDASALAVDHGVRAYVVAPGLQPHDLLAFLRECLPDYAVPAGVELLQALPRTPNGKVDRAALPRLRQAERPADLPDDEQGTPSEQAVAEAWRSVLGLGRVGLSANFFDIGGNSLTILAVQARLEARTGREIPVVDLFRHPTVRALAAHLDGDGSDPSLERAARRAAMRRERQGRRRLPLRPSRHPP